VICGVDDDADMHSVVDLMKSLRRDDDDINPHVRLNNDTLAVFTGENAKE